MSARERELELKLMHLSKSNALLLDKNKVLSNQGRLYRKKIKAITESRVLLRQKYGRQTAQLKKEKRKGTLFTYGGGAAIARHKYDVPTVRLCLSAYLLSGCSFRGVVRVLEYLRQSAGLDIAEVPCKSSIENWVKKCGYYLYEHPDLLIYSTGYALIIDECLVIGQERMLVILAVREGKEGEVALCLSGAQILLMEVKRSWSGDEIAKRIEKVEAKVGTKATYIISDSGANLIKGIGGCQAPRVGDCGHEIARQMEGLYKKEPRFVGFVAACAQSKFKLVMMPQGYLAAPRQRTIARFMNLWPLLKWASGLLRNIESLSGDDVMAYTWIEEHREIIEELALALKTANELLELLKNKGLSYASVAKCTQICDTFCKNTIGLPAIWMAGIKQYVQNEGSKLTAKGVVWHMSSDIIESLFGRYKEHKADNGLYGVTPFVLALPVLTKINAEKQQVNVDYKESLERTLMTDLKQWNVDHLIENQVIKRRKVLKT